MVGFALGLLTKEKFFWLDYLQIFHEYQNGGYGSTWAAPIASLMMEKYIKGYSERPNVEERMMKGVINYSVKKKKK